jgi:hypothetical protein
MCAAYPHGGGSNGARGFARIPTGQGRGVAPGHDGTTTGIVEET